MNNNKVFNFFHSNFDLVESSNGWYRFSGPFDNHKDNAMAVNFTYNIVKDYRSNYKSSIADFIRLLTNKSYNEVKKLIDKYTELDFTPTKFVVSDTIQVDLPYGFRLIDDGSIIGDRALKYLLDRGLSLELIKERSIGYCKEGLWFGRIIIPFMNPQLHYYLGRTFMNAQPKYMNAKKSDTGVGKSELFYNEQALKLNKIYLVEGVMDALSCGDEGVASLGWTLSDIQISKLIQSKADIYIIPDKGFYDKALTTAMSLIDHKTVYITNLDNIPEGMNDVNDIGLVGLQFERVSWKTKYL